MIFFDKLKLRTTWRIPLNAQKKRIAMYFCNALFYFILISE